MVLTEIRNLFDILQFYFRPKVNWSFLNLFHLAYFKYSSYNKFSVESQSTQAQWCPDSLNLRKVKSQCLTFPFSGLTHIGSPQFLSPFPEHHRPFVGWCMNKLIKSYPIWCAILVHLAPSVCSPTMRILVNVCYNCISLYSDTHRFFLLFIVCFRWFIYQGALENSCFYPAPPSNRPT